MKLDKEKPNVIFKREDGWQLIKNPKSLENFGKSVRGVIALNGDVYLETFSKGTIHQDILGILLKKGIIKENTGKGWGKKLPQESGFLTVQRYKDSKWIAIGESNKIIYNEEDWQKLVKNYDEVLAKAKKNCPNIDFSNKLVGVKFQGLKNVKSKETGDNTLKESYQINLIKYHLQNQ